MRPIDRLRRMVVGYDNFDEAVARRRVSDFLYDYRTLCEDVGPWQYAADLGAASDADMRAIAYLAVWADGPRLSVWTDVQRFDAVDLLIDAAAEGFESYVAAESAAEAH